MVIKSLTYKFKTFEPLNRIKHDFIDFNNNKIETNNVWYIHSIFFINFYAS